MEITLYKTSEENNKIDKTLSEPYKMIGSLRNESSVIRPSILVEVENPTNYNYMYIPDFGRYYFIKEMTSVRTNLWRLDCEVDVLKSYANEIKTLTVIIDKNKDYSRTNQYLDDGSFIIENKNTIEIKNVSNGFNDEASYVLVTAGA